MGGLVEPPTRGRRNRTVTRARSAAAAAEGARELSPKRRRVLAAAAVAVLVAAAAVAGLRSWPEAKAAKAFTDAGAVEMGGQLAFDDHMLFGYHELEVRGEQVVDLQAAEFENVDDGLVIEGIYVARYDAPGPKVGILRELGLAYRVELRPIHVAEMSGKEREWYPVIRVRRERPGVLEASSLRLDYEIDGKKGSQVFDLTIGVRS